MRPAVAPLPWPVTAVVGAGEFGGRAEGLPDEARLATLLPLRTIVQPGVHPVHQQHLASTRPHTAALGPTARRAGSPHPSAALD